jgi:RNA polymerase sigma factor (sigma-70 family)
METLSQPVAAECVQELYKRCCNDDPAVQGAALQELGHYLLRIACAQLKNQSHLAHTAEDCAQQALVTVWRKLSAGNGPNHAEWFLTWCASIVIHIVLDELRKMARSRVASLDEELPQLIARQGADTSVLSPYTFETPEDKARFITSIQNHPRLSADTKFVLLHGYLLELNDEELAQQLGKSRSTVRVLRFRGLQILRDDQHFMAMLSP